MLKTAIIGCGKIAGSHDSPDNPNDIRTHAKAYRLNKDTNLVAVVDQNVQQAFEFSKKWGGPTVFSDVGEMLSTVKPEIISICSPDETHGAILEKCLDCSNLKAVWCEKPVTNDIDQAKELVAAYKKKEIILAVNYQRRWNSAFERIKKILQQGKLGPTQKVIVYYSKGICHNGSHAIDLLLDWFGLPWKMEVVGKHIDFEENDPTVDARLMFGDILVSLIGFDEREYSIFEINIFGTLGRINIFNFGREIELFSLNEDAREIMSHGKVLKNEYMITMSKVLKNIADSIYTGELIRSNGFSALKTQKICCQLATEAKKIARY